MRLKNNDIRRPTFKQILIASVYRLNLLFYLGLWLSGICGNILSGIIFIALYRLSLWSAPWLVTALCWLPLKPKRSLKSKMIVNLVLLALCTILFLICYLTTGSWY